MKERTINLQPEQLVSICVDGSVVLKVMRSEDDEWVLVEEIADVRGIDRSNSARHEIYRRTHMVDGFMY